MDRSTLDGKRVTELRECIDKVARAVGEYSDHRLAEQISIIDNKFGIIAREMNNLGQRRDPDDAEHR